MKHSLSFLLCLSTVTLVACTGTAVPDVENAASSSSAEAASSIRETQNVSYQGIIEPAGMSIYMQGTHQLKLNDGRFILLESKDIDLDNYLNKKVGVFGATRPTVESNGTIMRVEEVMLLEDASSSPSSASSAEVSSALSSDAAASDAASSAAQTSSKTSAAKSSGAPSSATAASSVRTGDANDSVSADVSMRAAIMAKDNLAVANWSQRYCTTHIGFCFPVHKNWWFKSFGATTSSLWHVEISTGEIKNLNEGPIAVRLLSGNSAAKKATDGQVRIQGDWVMGYKDFGGNEHFEISAPANLQAAVSYITSHLVPGPTE